MVPTRKLGTNGPALTEIGFGAWAIGGPWKYGWGKQDDDEAVAAINTALETGVNWIDTAAAYGLGHSEELVARALLGRRERVFVATKGGIVWDDKQRVKLSIQPSSLKREFENSLRRLNTDYIDLYQIHWPDNSTPVESAWEVLLKLKQDGRARFVGVSNFDVPQLKKCLKLGPVDSLQPPYCLVKRRAEMEILPFCLEKGIGVVAYSPMMSGLLTGTFDPSRLAADDWRRGSAWFKEPLLGKALGLVRELAPLAEKHGRTVGQLAVAWVLKNPAVSAAIVGARRPAQVGETMEGAGWVLSEDESKEISEISARLLGDLTFQDF
jgi:aryl-alcohol dehydrogenase-like predicted oxidoreductase